MPSEEAEREMVSSRFTIFYLRISLVSPGSRITLAISGYANITSGLLFAYIPAFDAPCTSPTLACRVNARNVSRPVLLVAASGITSTTITWRFSRPARQIAHKILRPYARQYLNTITAHIRDRLCTLL